MDTDIEGKTRSCISSNNVDSSLLLPLSQSEERATHNNPSTPNLEDISHDTVYQKETTHIDSMVQIRSLSLAGRENENADKKE